MWWTEKPHFVDFCKAFNVAVEDNINILTLLEKYGPMLMVLKDIYNGKESRVYNSDYRLEEVEEATELKHEN
jgi:hypothetical protein